MLPAFSGCLCSIAPSSVLKGLIQLQTQTPPTIYQRIAPNSAGLLATQNNVS